MNLIASKKDLLVLLAAAQGIADKKAAMPVLVNVLLSAEGAQVRVAATDLYMAISNTAPAEVTEPGSIALPAKDLFERVKAMPEGPIQIVTTDVAATVKAIGSPRRFTLHGMPGADFPQLPKIKEEATSFSLPAATLATLIARTHFSISTDETRAHVNSAFFEWHKAGLRMVTTDGHRLSKADAAIDIDVPGAGWHALIPSKAVAELRKILDGAKGGNVDFTVSDPNAFLTVGTMQFSVKLIDATFPPYQQVIPSTWQRSGTLPRVQFADALRAVSLACSDGSRGGVKLTQDHGLLKITSESPESGNGFDEVGTDWAEDAGPDKYDTIGVNAKYLLDILGVISEEEVVIRMGSALDPILLVPASEAGQAEYVAVAMPMRLT